MNVIQDFGLTGVYRMPSEAVQENLGVCIKKFQDFMTKKNSSFYVRPWIPAWKCEITDIGMLTLSAILIFILVFSEYINIIFSVKWLDAGAFFMRFTQELNIL